MTIKVVFYSTAGYHSGHDGNTYVETGANAYPYASGLGYNVGFTTLTSVLFTDNSTSVDHRLGGDVMCPAWALRTYRIQLPSAGEYDIALALGTMNASPSAVHAKMYDNTTQFGSTIGPHVSVSGGNFYDATGVLRTSASDWVSNNALITRTFASNTFNLEFQVGSDYKLAAHIGVYPVGGGDTLLVVNDISQSQSIDNLALTQANVLAVADTTQSQAIDNIVLTQANVIALDGLSQSQSIDNIDLVQAHTLSVAESAQSQSIDNITLTQSGSLSVAGTDQAQSIDNIDLVQAHVISVADSMQSQTIDAVALIQSNILTVADSSQSQSIDNIALSMSVVLNPADLTQSQSIGGIALTQAHLLTVQEILQSQSSDNITLTQNSILVVADITQSQSIDRISWIAVVTPAGRIYAINAENRIYAINAENRVYSIN